jgi:hypothetical protein
MALPHISDESRFDYTQSNVVAGGSEDGHIEQLHEEDFLVHMVDGKHRYNQHRLH